LERRANTTFDATRWAQLWAFSVQGIFYLCFVKGNNSFVLVF